MDNLVQYIYIYIKVKTRASVTSYVRGNYAKDPLLDIQYLERTQKYLNHYKYLMNTIEQFYGTKLSFRRWQYHFPKLIEWDSFRPPVVEYLFSYMLFEVIITPARYDIVSLVMFLRVGVVWYMYVSESFFDFIFLFDSQNLIRIHSVHTDTLNYLICIFSYIHLLYSPNTLYHCYYMLPLSTDTIILNLIGVLL